MRIVRSSSIGNNNKRNKRSVRDKEVRQFTHEDIKNGVVHFVPGLDGLNKQSIGGSSLNDSFHYRLVAPGVQPANGVFDFTMILQVSQINQHLL